MQKPDTATAKDTGSGFDPHPEGQYPMVCVDVVNLGTKVEQYGDSEPREVEKAALVFASGEKQDDGTLMIVTAEMTLSMHEKANMRHFLESWRGKSYTPEQAEAGVPLHKLHSQPALVSIEHILTKRGKRFAKIRSISPLPKQMDAPEAELVERYSRPPFFEDRKKEYAEGLAKHRQARQNGDDPGPEYPGDEHFEEDDDGLPF